jgi:phage N-6-adenine-methyltransferase
MTTMVAAVPEKELLVIERLAAALEKAASVDEIKDVRDRAMSIQLYARKKAGGLAAAQAAGRIVTEATLRLAELYKGEGSARGDGAGGKGGGTSLDRKQDSLPGKVAIARAAHMDPAALSRLAPVVSASKPEIRAAMTAIEERGGVVTPNALRVQLSAVSAAADYDGDEWYTPPDVVERARGVLGEIDLDPASCAFAQKVVKARRFYTAADDGRSKPWQGRVFCNPPYSPTLICEFTAKLLSEKPDAAVYLVNNATDTRWFHSALEACNAVCLLKGRLPFYNRAGATQAARQGQVAFYFGRATGRFRDAFSPIGAVMEPSR